MRDAFTPEVINQLKRSAPGIDSITYADCRWVDPLGLILTTIFNVCRLNARVPSPWKRTTVTLKGRGYIICQELVSHQPITDVVQVVHRADRETDC